MSSRSKKRNWYMHLSATTSSTALADSLPSPANPLTPRLFIHRLFFFFNDPATTEIYTLSLQRRSSDPVRTQHVEQAVLDPPVEHRIGRLVDQQRGTELAQDAYRLAGLLRVVRGDAGVQRLAGAYRRVQRAHRLLKRSVRVEAVRVEDVDVVQPHPAQ